MKTHNYKILQGPLVKYKGIVGYLVKEFNNSIVVFQPDNGRDGAFVVIPRRLKGDLCCAYVGGKPDAMSEARLLEGKRK